MIKGADQQPLTKKDDLNLLVIFLSVIKQHNRKWIVNKQRRLFITQKCKKGQIDVKVCIQ